MAGKILGALYSPPYKIASIRQQSLSAIFRATVFHPCQCRGGGLKGDGKMQLPPGKRAMHRAEGVDKFTEAGVCRIWGRVAHSSVICAPIKTRDHNPSRRFIRLLIEQPSI